MLMCHGCAMCMASSIFETKRKLITEERQQLHCALSGLLFSCGSPLQDISYTIPDALADIIYVKKLALQCNDRVETLYNYANYTMTSVCVLLY